MKYKNIFGKFEDENLFIKTTVSPQLDGSSKAALNRKGNVLFNAGDIEEARRIFITTGYSDGLSRVGDYYKSHNRPLEALKMYWLAPDKKKYDPLVTQLAGMLQNLLKESEGSSNV